MTYYNFFFHFLSTDGVTNTIRNSHKCYPRFKLRSLYRYIP